MFLQWWIEDLKGMSNFCMYELQDNVWDEFVETDDHIVPNAGDKHKDQFAVQGDSCKKSLQELQGIKRTDYVRNYDIQSEEELYLPNLNRKEGMLKKGSSWSHKPEGLFSSCEGDSCKELKRLTSDNTKMSDHCFKSSNVDSSSSKLCADDTIMGNKCMVGDDNVSQYSINHTSQTDNELSFLDNDLWMDIGNFEDVDRTMSCDLTFGMESLDNEDGFAWLSSSHGTEGSDDALKSGFKFASAEMCPLKSLSDYNIALKENIEGLPINDCNQKTSPIDEKLGSQMDVDHDAVPAPLSTCSESDMISGNTNDRMPEEKGKMSKPLTGKRRNLENGDFVRPYAHMEEYANLKQPFGTSSSGVTSQGSIQKHKQNMDSSILIQNSQMNQNCCEYDYSRGALGDFVCSDSQLLNGGFKSENIANPLPFQNPGSALQVCHKFENENEGHSEVGGVSIGFSQEIDSSNLHESSSMSSALDNISLQAASFCQLQRVMDQLDIRTKLCIRDSLYRLARSAEKRHTNANTNGQIGGDVETFKAMKTPDANNCTGFMDIETNTNPIDRSIAHLLFHRPSDPSMFPRNDNIPFKSSSMVHGIVTNLPVMNETPICQEESPAGVEKKSLRVTPS
ncbi:PREDICTED: protein LNK1-like isoform X2 [Lupinus angustifolius]|uniref:protein LNK1-like isoform X2 n=1 Tax=Lupinus angustifolius TaxID=3871 RepID=UPI00092E2971|nr:PREDICTED: protein LNK1-like isoform X2 [Lupinus angustifolius]